MKKKNTPPRATSWIIFLTLTLQISLGISASNNTKANPVSTGAFIPGSAASGSAASGRGVVAAAAGNNGKDIDRQLWE